MIKNVNNAKGSKNMTAAEQYAESIKAVREQIAILEAKVNNHEVAQKAEPKNWGFAGDMGHIREELEDLNETLVEYVAS